MTVRGQVVSPAAASPSHQSLTWSPNTPAKPLLAGLGSSVELAGEGIFFDSLSLIESNCINLVHMLFLQPLEASSLFSVNTLLGSRKKENFVRYPSKC